MECAPNNPLRDILDDDREEYLKRVMEERYGINATKALPKDMETMPSSKGDGDTKSSHLIDAELI